MGAIMRPWIPGNEVSISVEGDLSTLLSHIAERKVGYKIHATALVVDDDGHWLTKEQLRYRFDTARVAADTTFQLRDVRAKTGTDRAEDSGDVRRHRSCSVTAP